jgi:hypothetical protein
MKIAVPTGPLYAPLVAHIDEVCARRGWQVVHAEIEACGRMLLTHAVDAALISPLGYGHGVAKVDYRIVPGMCVMLQDYTNIAGIDFRPGAASIITADSATPDEFLVTIGTLVVAEKLDVDLQVHARADEPADCMIDLVQPGARPMMDVSEEWSDLTDAPLPVAIWVCRVEADIDAISSAVTEMADARVETPVSEMVPLEGDHFPREGNVLYRWSEETEEALAAVLDVLYYHQLLPEIPAVKLLGRD